MLENLILEINIGSTSIKIAVNKNTKPNLLRILHIPQKK
jgi:hypothetical protein